jgi:hypothetical protein
VANEATTSSRTRRGNRSFDLEQFCAVLTTAWLALVRIFVPPTAISTSQSFADQRRHALRQEPTEGLDAFDPEVGKPVVVRRHASRQPSIGRVALRKPLQFAR